MSTYIVTNKSVNTITMEGVEIAPGKAQSVMFEGALPLYVSVMRDQDLISLRQTTDVAGAVLIDPDTGLPYKAGGGAGGGGTSDTTEATQLLVKAAAQGVDMDLGSPADAARFAVSLDPDALLTLDDLRGVGQ